jgi:catechol 2,3-dioxygenase
MTSQPVTKLLPDRIEMGTVALAVRDLERSLDYYRRVIGLELLERQADHAVLGAGGGPLLELEAHANAERDRQAADLFHFALLVPSRAALGRQLGHFVASDTRLTGASDHLVSEALYLRDPDGHGIEIYRDRPRADWYADGEFLLGTEALDLEGVLEAGRAAGGQWDGIDPGTVMGHVHLETLDLKRAKGFYVDTLGFDVMKEMLQASFVSVGGYHHHLAFNTWGNRTRRAEPDRDAIAMRWYEIRLPDRAALDRVAAGLGSDAPRDGWLEVPDPNGLVVRFTAPA